MEAKQDKTPEELEIEKYAKQAEDARERLAKVETKRLLRDKRREAEEAVREAEEAEVLEQLETEHGELGREIMAVRTPDGLIVVKRSPGVVWHRYENSKMKPSDREQLCLASVVYPDIAQYKKMVQGRPAVILLLTEKLQELYGFKRNEDAGK
ncbi:MAG: hypothetical protein HOW73_34665 [Polyangiaceae bacterium]|nr:hypothetical protein [Polyangiaceae bacterium]